MSKQETDQAVSELPCDESTVDSNMSNVRRLEELQGFQKIYAPFDGVITARNTDIGALINSGASTPAQELFHLAAINTLRVFVAVPQLYSQAVRPGATASLTLDEFPGKSFSGTIARNSNSIDPASRTLLVEVDVDNRNGTCFRELMCAFISNCRNRSTHQSRYQPTRYCSAPRACAWVWFATAARSSCR